MGLIGSGLGRATNSARALGETKLVETYYPKVLFEVGIVGCTGLSGFGHHLNNHCFQNLSLDKKP